MPRCPYAAPLCPSASAPVPRCPRLAACLRLYFCPISTTYLYLCPSRSLALSPLCITCPVPTTESHARDLKLGTPYSSTRSSSAGTWHARDTC
eukprot:15439434-Alexandrium_andersonii.AAC.1